MVEIIVAHDENRVIGIDNKIPWKVPEDMALFKKTTMGHTIICGRKTWDSIPKKYRPLEGRDNIVVSKTLKDDSAKVVSSLEEAISISDKNKKIFVIGGSQLYEYALDNNLVSRVIISLIKGSHIGDAYFPTLDSMWKLDKYVVYDKFDLLEYKKDNV